MQKMKFGQEIFREIDLFDFTIFFALDFFHFLTHCVSKGERFCGLKKKMSENIDFFLHSKQSCNNNYMHFYYTLFLFLGHHYTMKSQKLLNQFQGKF